MGMLAFIRTNVADPLLCLTASATLRDKPLTTTPQRRNLTDLLIAAGPLPPLSQATSPVIANNGEEHPDEDEENSNFTGFEEVNLLDGLAAGAYYSQTQKYESFTDEYDRPDFRAGTRIERLVSA